MTTDIRDESALQEVSHPYNSAGPRCPYCNHLHSPDEPFYWDEDTSEMECERCDRLFELQVHTSTCWSSRPKEGTSDVE